ncbi:AI-2E family transporter [Tropicibacter sp. Alg240-R139]|uniref:AI-2E family transporter n=1 Tax=Tropicibacter sp. Alg240-R139 TaxID=2305991 RepID=UPI0013E065A9|nr:AI-2E family transporter [Tropicibacter sp. Alg240-R139]
MDKKEEHISGLSTQYAVSVFAILGSIAIIVTALILGATFFIPLSIALLLFVLLTATIQWITSLEWRGYSCPRWLAHILAICGVILGLFGAATIIGRQASQVAAAVPLYQERFAQIFQRIISVVGEENAKMAKEQLSSLNISGVAVDAADQAGGFLGGLILVILYIAFMLAEAKPMTRKMSLAFRDSERHERIQRVSKEVVSALQLYVGVKTLCSAVAGALCYTILRLVGLDFAETWALLTFALNFIPSIGAIVAVLFPAIVALLQFESIGPLSFVLLGCGLVQFVVGNIVEPAIMGRRLNLAPFMVILSLTVWSTIWGIAGAFLSVPITVCLLIAFGHVPAGRPLAILMSGDGLLPQPEPSCDSDTGKNAVDC